MKSNAKNNIILQINQESIYKEAVRKSIHMTISLVPLLASVSVNFTLTLLVSGLFIYTVSEYYRSKGVTLFNIISSISAIASRDRDKGMTFGPITLAMGALVVLWGFSPAAAACGIYALAFGDGLSSITGKLWGRIKIPFTGGKSVVGSATCFTMILSTTYGVTGSINKALVAALAGTVTELIPVKDLDNLMLPFVVAVIASI